MVTILKTHSDVLSFRAQHKGKSLAFVPTMGNLHEGHLSLMEIACQRADLVVCSIFVNPTQFGVNEDLADYPRTLEKDVEKLNSVGVDAVFFPDTAVIYPLGSDNSIRIMPPDSLTKILCGIQRPTHFQGVATVVVKLLQIVKPDVAIFGEKDFQQLAIIRRLIRALFMTVQIEGGPIIREANGLAMSSRNQYLTEKEFDQARALFQTLKCCSQKIKTGQAVSVVLSQGKAHLNSVGAKVEYLDFRDIDSLAAFPEQKRGILLVAARLGKTRLIDNLRMVAIE